jgi:hypothetical protein
MKRICLPVISAVILFGSCLQAAAAPADNINDAKFALKYKGEDTAESACQYYKAIGAVKNCGPNGELEPNFNFDQWKRMNGFAVNPDMDRNGTAFDFIDQLISWLFSGEVSALYLNAQDLNLGRAMHGRQDKDKVAYYVCNYETIEDARFNKGLKACVAMDYSVVAKDVNEGKPFTKFYVFDNHGKLTPAVELDRQGPKFVPGLCVACHGGDNYPQKLNSSTREGFPEDGTGHPDLSARFLPFDLDNFEYLDHPQFTRKAQEPQFRQLNQFIFGTNVAPVVEQLLYGWYPRRYSTQQSNFVPPGWDLDRDPAIQDPSLQFSPRELYREVVKPSCRTCHSVMAEGINWSTYEKFRGDSGTIQPFVCGDNDPKNKNAVMPNAMVTLDRFWLSQHPHQPDILTTFLRGALNDQTIMCPEPAP